MIYTLGWNGLKNYKELHNSKNSNQNLDKPSYPKYIRQRIPGLLEILKTKSENLLSKHSWLNDIQTSIEFRDNSIRYAHHHFGTIDFESIEVGRYDINSSVWSWAWIDDDNGLIKDAQSMRFRDYGSEKDIEVLTKGRWYTTADEKLEIVAFCGILLPSVGLEIQENRGVERFYFLY